MKKYFNVIKKIYVENIVSHFGFFCVFCSVSLSVMEKVSVTITESNLKQDDFIPGGIHKEQAKLFWKNILNANDWVLDVLEHGYSLPFYSIPVPSCEKNKASARKNIEFV